MTTVRSRPECEFLPYRDFVAHASGKQIGAVALARTGCGRPDDGIGACGVAAAH